MLAVKLDSYIPLYLFKIDPANDRCKHTIKHYTHPKVRDLPLINAPFETYLIYQNQIQTLIMTLK